MKYDKPLIFSLMTLLLLSCRSSISVPEGATGPVVIYKTKQDYRNQVSVQLSADGKSIVAYPAPADVLFQKPVELAEGYLLKRMIGDAWLSLTIDIYADSSSSFTVGEMLELVIDPNPYLEKYDCSGCVKSDTASINRLIRAGRLKECKSLL